MSLDKILSYLKLSLWQAAVLGVATALLLFDPFGWNPAGLGAFQVFVILLFGLASSNLLLIALSMFQASVSLAWALRTRKKRLAKLTPDEKALLRKFIFGNTRLVQLPMTSGVATRLVEAEVLYINPGLPSCIAPIGK